MTKKKITTCALKNKQKSFSKNLTSANIMLVLTSHKRCTDDDFQLNYNFLDLTTTNYNKYFIGYYV